MSQKGGGVTEFLSDVDVLGRRVEGLRGGDEEGSARQGKDSGLCIISL